MGNIDKKVLNSIYQASKIGLDSAEYLYGKVKDKKLKKDINNYAKRYFDILSQTKEKIDTGYNIATDYTPINEFIWNGIENIDIFDDNKVIAKVLIDGSKEAISSIMKYSNNDMVDDDIKKIADNLIMFEKQNIENIKKYIL